MDPVASTAHWVAAARARESQRPDALFQDPFAAALAGEEGERWIESPSDEVLVSTYIALRTRFFDEQLLHAAQDGIRQFVILAAGLDARAFRLDWPEGTRLFELDRPEVLAHKNNILAASRATPRCLRITLGANLTLPWADALRTAGLAPSERSAWLVEGLLPYLHEADVRRLFMQLSTLAAPGSALALDCTGTDPFTTPAFADQAAKMRARGIEMHFSCDDPVALLAGFGWAAQSVTVNELAARAGRPIPWQEDGEDPLHSHLVAATRRA
ncbi:MAG: SAM-dependent methyltransferase [Minicystis sp.]